MLQPTLFVEDNDDFHNSSKKKMMTYMKILKATSQIRSNADVSENIESSRGVGTDRADCSI